MRTRGSIVAWVAAAASCVLALAGIATAQEPAHIVSTTIEPGDITVGDRMALTIVVEHAADVTVEGPGFDADFGDVEIVEIEEPRVDERDDSSTTTLRYIVTSFAPGEASVPPLPVTYRGPSGEETILTNVLFVSVQSVLSPGDTSLRPLKPQLGIDEGAPTPALPALFVALMAGLTAFGYWLLRHAIDARPVALPHVTAPASPVEQARARLDALAAGPRDDVDAYYAEIAATVRAYLSARFGFGAYAMTRRELQRGMARAGIDRWPARVTANLLEQCDAVQFARFRPPPERMDADLTAGYEIIELTRPMETAEISGTAPIAP
jgi:hypothetical protein